jgi:anaerobic selenocysteine-containing dehydrogenase
MKQERQAKVGRRDFLRALGVGASAAVAGAGSLGSEARADTETADEKKKPRYRESEHVKAYYRVNRYPK